MKDNWREEWRWAESEQCVRANIEHPKDGSTNLAVEYILAHFGTKIESLLATQKLSIIEGLEVIRRENKAAKPADYIEQVDERAYDAAMTRAITLVKEI